MNHRARAWLVGAACVLALALLATVLLPATTRATSVGVTGTTSATSTTLGTGTRTGTVPATSTASSTTTIPGTGTTAGSTGATGPGSGSAAVGLISGVLTPGLQGISIEAGDVPRYAAALHAFTQAMKLIEVPGTPVPLRIGGSSADRVWWMGMAQPRPPGNFPVGTPWIADLKQVAAVVPTDVTLDLNLPADEPGPEAQFALAVNTALAPSELYAVEIGNEPDLYSNQDWMANERPQISGQAWNLSYTPQAYRDDYIKYARAIRALIPGVLLQGPDSVQPGQGWLEAPLVPDGLAANVLSVHRYGFSYCLKPTFTDYPTLARLLDPLRYSYITESLAAPLQLAAARHDKLIIGEFNSMSCAAGQQLSASYPTALWALGALFSLGGTGVSTVDWHVRPGVTNAPFTVTSTGLKVAPELYSMAVFAGLDQPGTSLLHTTSSDPSVPVWAVSHGDRVTAVMVNYSDFPQTITVSLPATGTADLRQLIDTRGKITFAGQIISSAGLWAGKPHVQLVDSTAGRYTVVLPPLSAATLTAKTAGRTRTTPGQTGTTSTTPAS